MKNPLWQWPHDAEEEPGTVSAGLHTNKGSSGNVLQRELQGCPACGGIQVESRTLDSELSCQIRQGAKPGQGQLIEKDY